MHDLLKLTILTATLNADRFINRLIDSLRNQSDKNFTWIIVDGQSSDSTIELISAAVDLDCKVLQGKDFGIYDALNRGINTIESGYYLVVGADDILSVDAIKNYRAAASDGEFDIITTSILQDGRVLTPRKNLGWLYGLSGIASSHAVGMIINVKMHQKFGFYSKNFPIAADQLFIKTCLAAGAKISRRNFIAGEFSTEGTSGLDPIGLLTDVFRVQLLTEKRFLFFQYFIFFSRLSKFYLTSNFKRIK